VHRRRCVCRQPPTTVAARHDAPQHATPAGLRLEECDVLLQLQRKAGHGRLVVVVVVVCCSHHDHHHHGLRVVCACALVRVRWSVGTHVRSVRSFQAGWPRDAWRCCDTQGHARIIPVTPGPRVWAMQSHGYAGASAAVMGRCHVVERCCSVAPGASSAAPRTQAIEMPWRVRPAAAQRAAGPQRSNRRVYPPTWFQKV
jgi:hypothetical protein